MIHGVIREEGVAKIGYKITRREPFAVDDTICHYHWRVEQMTKIKLLVHAEGRLEHRHGDGNAVLVSKVLSLAGSQLMVAERVAVAKYEAEELRKKEEIERKYFLKGKGIAEKK